MTNVNIQELCDEWKKILKMQNWQIKAGIYRERDFYNSGCTGENSFDMKTEQAIIRIMSDEDYHEYYGFPNDKEKTIVHELLHLLFYTFEQKDKNSMEHNFMEQTINRIADVLVKLKREGISEK